ncbi:tetratricopeptide repeat protein 24 [Cygnus olor]|uniref:tetratricopeptide repeat protein 24 n=1 Tax=Cygnus olor TaxID=8869 RepID=UPI001ADE9BDF|nr:tetratricopeptide repeat protein 24 [Cygnus olor]
MDPMARRRKSRKKGKEKLAVVEEAEEGGNGAAGRAAEIERLMQAGHRALGLRDVRGALACFRKAFLLSLGTASPRLRRVCAFNLGAAYVEAGKPRKGLKFLLESQPAEGEPLGGLYFNIGAADEGLRDFPKALEYFGKAAGPCRAGSQAVEMGCCYLGMQEPARAARCFLEAAHSYAVAESPEAAAVALSRASGSMLQSRRFGAAEIARILTWCRSLCDSIADPALRGKLYNEVGLGFSQLHVFSLASESFERALALCQGTLGRRGEAALLQNLGAARNALRSFGTALGLHRQAAALHGAVGNRRAQGQCFGNLAYAFSQLGNHEAAAENYLHALQAFRDSGDVQGQWQACEGLGAARFHLGNPQKAVGHYQEALTLLSHCPVRETPGPDPPVRGERQPQRRDRLAWGGFLLRRAPPGRPASGSSASSPVPSSTSSASTATSHVGVPRCR